MAFSIATWNINSIRLRLPIVARLLAELRPDVLCLQETKCPDELFPVDAIRSLGYSHVAANGQKGYHGVATISRRPIEVVEKRRFCDNSDCRHLSVRLTAGGKSLLVHNFYVPAGGDEPDPDINPKFRHKLDFVNEMNAVRAEHDAMSASVLVGDLNIAPLEHDVWSHRQLLKVVSHTPVETQAFEAMRESGGWTDLMRLNVPWDEKLYTWWSYRAADWQRSDRGRRLDHVWSSRNLVDSLRDVEIVRRRAAGSGPRITSRSSPASSSNRRSIGESRREPLNFADHRLEILQDAPVERRGGLGIFVEDAPEHFPAEPDDFGIGGGGSAGRPPCLGDQRQLAEHRAGSGGPYGNAFPTLLAKQADAAFDHDIGGVGVIVLAVKPPVPGQEHGLGAEGEQPQLLLREALEQPHAGQDADIVIQRHSVPGSSAWRTCRKCGLPVRCQGTSLYPPLSVTRISALEGSRSIFWRSRYTWVSSVCVVTPELYPQTSSSSTSRVTTFWSAR